VELPLCLLRAALTAPPALKARVLEALLEDLVLLVLVRQQGRPGRPGSATQRLEDPGNVQPPGDQLMTVPLEDDTVSLGPVRKEGRCVEQGFGCGGLTCPYVSTFGPLCYAGPK
jgi:hypothetical protein